MSLPEQGLTKDEIMSALHAKQHDDARWREGRTFGMVYDGGPSVHEVAEAVAVEFLHENALNTKAFPGLGQIQSEVVGIAAELFHGGTASGFMTSGGTSPSCARSRRPGSGGRPSGVSPNRRWSCPRAPTPRSTRAPTTSGSR